MTARAGMAIVAAAPRLSGNAGMASRAAARPDGERKPFRGKRRFGGKRPAARAA